MKYNGVLIAVSDMENSRRFYRDVLGLKVIEDFGANVTLEVYSAGNPQSPDYECGIWVPIQ